MPTQENLTHPDDQAARASRTGFGRKAAGLLLAGGLVTGVGTAVAINRHDSAPKDVVTSQESDNARAQFIQEVALPKLQDKFLAAKLMASLKEGAVITNERGVTSTITSPVENILNPVWIPVTEGEPSELCYTSTPGEAACFALNGQNQAFLGFSKEGADGAVHEVSPTDVSPADATEVTVTALDHGRAYSEALHQYIAAIPGDFLTAPTELPS